MRRAAVAAMLQNPHAAAATAVPVPPPVIPPGDGGLSAMLPHVIHAAAAAAQGAGTAAQAVWPNNPLLHPVIACEILWRGCCTGRAAHMTPEDVHRALITAVRVKRRRPGLPWSICVAIMPLTSLGVTAGYPLNC